MLLRALPRTGPRVSSGCTCICPSRRLAGSVRTFRTSTPLTAATFESSQQRSDNQPPTSSKSQQHKSMHAIANPTLAGIEKRWEEMPPQKQAELWMLLRDRMKVDWHEMTLQEKKIGMQVIHLMLGPELPRIRLHHHHRQERLHYKLFPLPRSRSTVALIACLLTKVLHCSVVDCLWSTWTPRRRSSRRMDADILMVWCWMSCCWCVIRYHPSLRTATAPYHDKRMAGSHQWISQGKRSSSLELFCGCCTHINSSKSNSSLSSLL